MDMKLCVYVYTRMYFDCASTSTLIVRFKPYVEESRMHDIK